MNIYVRLPILCCEKDFAELEYFSKGPESEYTLASGTRLYINWNTKSFSEQSGLVAKF
jgi:hypothetical protein